MGCVMLNMALSLHGSCDAEHGAICMGCVMLNMALCVHGLCDAEHGSYLGVHAEHV